MTIQNCRFLELPTIGDPRGDLTFIEGRNHIPFDIRRVYYLHNVPKGSERGGHAHRALHQLIVAVSGSFVVHLNDGENSKSVRLEKPNLGFYVCPMIWRDIDCFSKGSVCMVLASDYYDEADYYRDFRSFVRDVGKVNKWR